MFLPLGVTVATVVVFFTAAVVVGVVVVVVPVVVTVIEEIAVVVVVVVAVVTVDKDVDASGMPLLTVAAAAVDAADDDVETTLSTLPWLSLRSGGGNHFLLRHTNELFVLPSTLTKFRDDIQVSRQYHLLS